MPIPARFGIINSFQGMKSAESTGIGAVAGVLVLRVQHNAAIVAHKCLPLLLLLLLLQKCQHDATRGSGERRVTPERALVASEEDDVDRNLARRKVG